MTAAKKPEHHLAKTLVPGSYVDSPGAIAYAATKLSGRKNSYGAPIGCSLTSKPCFAVLKADLGFGLSFIVKKSGLTVHLFITVLAYQFVQLIRRRLYESGGDKKGSWRTLREIMLLNAG